MSLFKDVASEYVEMVVSPEQVRHVIDRAIRIAKAQRAPTCIIVPNDVQELPAEAPPRMHNTVHSGIGYAIARPIPTDHELQRAADALNAGRKVAMLVGAGALNAAAEVIEVADALGAGIAKALLGKAVVPDALSFVTGSIGLLGTRPSYRMMMDCDTLLMVGSSFPYLEFLPKPGQARGIQIELDPARIGLRYPVEVGLVGDSRRTLRALMPILQRHEDRTFLEQAQKGMREWWELLERHATAPSVPMKPQVLADQLSRHLRDDAITCCDSGTIATWWARYIRVKRGQMHTLSGNLATMACALPYAIAAQIAYPERQVVAFVGDGGFSMLMAEFVNCVKYQLPIKVIIVKNNSLGMIKWEQMVFLGNPEYGCELQPIDFAAFGRACGATAFSVEDPSKCGSVLDEAFATKGPVIVEATVDPFEPPMPPKVSLDQAAKFAESLAKGTPHRNKIALTVLADKVRELV
jgi:pyruvate dehydrogenase (quinone)/pyruvate oxidase